MKEQEKKRLVILYLINELVGSTVWHGETNADNDSFENMKIVDTILETLLKLVYENATLPENSIGTDSGKMLYKQAQSILEWIHEYYNFDNIN